jgi:nucleoside phosphorylase
MMTLRREDICGRVDFAILTVREDEFEAVLQRLGQRKPVRGVGQNYEVAAVRDQNGNDRLVAVVRQLEQGQTAAHAATAAILRDLEPAWIVLTGIAGGIADGEFSLGDVLLASRVHDFSVHASTEGNVTYQQGGGPVHPEVKQLLAALPAWRDRLGDWNTPTAIGREKPRVQLHNKSLYGPPEYRTRVRASLLRHFPRRIAPRPPLYRVGPVGTSNGLIKDTLRIEHWQESARQLTHVEMEAGGAYDAAAQRNRPLLCVRGISDVVGLVRQSEWTAYACHSAASFVLALIKSGAIERPARDGARRPSSQPPPPSAQPPLEDATKRSARDKSPGGSGPFWATDAIQMIAIGRELEKVVHHNKLIDRFLEGEKFFLCAAKGMGKTLLLAFKRFLLENGSSKAGLPSAPTGVQFVPSGKPYLDMMSDIPSMTKENQVAYSNISHAKRIWSLSLKLSALSHVGVTQFRGESLPADLAGHVRDRRGIDPTEVFQGLAGMTVSKLNQTYDAAQYEIEHCFRDIRSGLVMFVDRVDQALMSLEKGAWIGLQCGLIEAAWDLMVANSHVKCFATVRQEAYSNYRSATKPNLAGAVTEVAYEPQDLRKMLDRLTSWYEKRRSFSDFTGLKDINNAYADCEEDAYRFLYRHTLGRPRDLVERGLDNRWCFEHAI